MSGGGGRHLRSQRRTTLGYVRCIDFASLQSTTSGRWKQSSKNTGLSDVHTSKHRSIEACPAFDESFSFERDAAALRTQSLVKEIVQLNCE